MEKFRKKPVVIDAIQLTEKNIKQCYELVNNEKVNLLGSMNIIQWENYEKNVIKNGLDVPTLEDGEDRRAKHVASIGDYIIKGVSGEFYPCKPDIFNKTYEKV
jgi:hypothetical protein